MRFNSPERPLSDFYPDDPKIMLERKFMDDLVQDRKPHSFCHEEFWHPMDTFQKSRFLNEPRAQDQAPWRVW